MNERYFCTLLKGEISCITIKHGGGRRWQADGRHVMPSPRNPTGQGPHLDNKSYYIPFMSQGYFKVVKT